VPSLSFHHVSLSVTDLDASASWYADTFGFEELFREEAEARRACVMVFADGGYSVGLVEHGASAGEPFDAVRTGLDHLALAVPSRADLDRWAARLDAAGIAHSGPVDIPVGAILNLRDPDGMALALFWDRDVAEAPTRPPVG